MHGIHGICYTMQAVQVEKDIGVWTDSKLRFSDHVVHTVTKSNQIVGVIRSLTYLTKVVI